MSTPLEVMQALHDADIPPNPKLMLMSPTIKAMFNAYFEFEGRDRRRIKREVNKAVARARIRARIERAGDAQLDINSPITTPKQTLSDIWHSRP